ncbi:MAG: arginine--tRNA ligase [Actinomycetota bacterium]
MLTDQLSDLILEALQKAAADGEVVLEGSPPITLERPKRREHGDWSTNVALVVASSSEGEPRSLAQAIIDRLPPSNLIDRAEVAGPGFLNLHLSPLWLHDVLRRAADAETPFARSTEGSETRVNVEYVSANPTGPANVVSGRHAAVGDAIANLLEATGCEVVREFYANDAGRQIWLFARSVEAHYLRSFGREAELPEDGYLGNYVKDLAEDIAAHTGDELLDVDEEKRVATLREMALARMLGSMRLTLERFGTRFDRWFSESSLHGSGAVSAAIQRLEQRGWVEERDGARWFLTSRLGDDKDRVLVRSDGTPTYLGADVAYMLDKFERGFDRLIYVLGSDHHGTLAARSAMAEALGFGRERVEFPLVQNITILRGDETVAASKRAGVLVPLDEVVEEVGSDATRYTFLTRSIDAPLEFDVDLVKEQAPENPVYYTQYAHARICSILRKAGEQGLTSRPGAAQLERLGHASEDALMRKLAAYEEVVPQAARLRAPQRIARYVEELASAFSAFYRDCRVVSEDAALTQARLVLCEAARRVIADALRLLGVSAPERM